MTETSSAINTHTTPHILPVITHPSATSPLPNGTYSDSNLPEEEEYTIKCICVYADDDGNTVYCEQCDTWQHIECYYHGKKVPEVHFCADCQPRDLDGKRATERQRRVREQLEGGDRKVKRPSTKTSKKSKKESAPHELTNGWTHHERHDSMSNGNGRDQPPPAKKPKTSHRTSGSVVSLNGESRKRAHSNLQSYPSPSKSPQDHYRYPYIPQYTIEFLELYDRDEGTTSSEGNTYTIAALNQLSRWKSDPTLLVHGYDQQPNNTSPMVYIKQGEQQTTRPPVSLETFQNTDVEVDGRHPLWRFLRIQQPVKKDTVIGETQGEVGMLEEYCNQQSFPNRWPELQHPDPFVFFHPHMNIYIDSRKKGTLFRYLRRSCQPNVTLKTFVTDDGDARHCFVANQDISAGSELTAAWFINTAMFAMHADRENSEQMETRRSDWISRVLANFGNCACGDNGQCPWARYDRRSSAKAHEGSSKQGLGRKRKLKSKQAVSPTSTGHATNSRAGSEVNKGADDDDQDDRRSTSGSTPSGQRSRDLTPVNVAVLDADPVLGSGLTARELRKIQAAEKAFEKSHQRASDDKRKKKRPSGGSNLNTPNPGSSKFPGHSSIQADVKQFSGSPPPSRSMRDNKTMAGINSGRARPLYASVGTQTDPDYCEADLPSPTRIRYITPTQRLLNKIKADRDRCLKMKSNSVASPTSSRTGSLDVEMKDAGSGMSPVTVESPNMPKMTVPLPSQAAHTQKIFKQPSVPKLHLSTLPPVPAFASGGQTPTLATPTTQSPQLIGPLGILGMTANMVTPSPVKKKMSLGDYMSRRNQASTPSSEKSQAQAWSEGGRDQTLHRSSSTAGSDAMSETSQIRPSAAIAEEAQRRGGMEGSAIDDTPVKDESEPEYSPSAAVPAGSELLNTQLEPSSTTVKKMADSTTIANGPNSRPPLIDQPLPIEATAASTGS